MKVGVRRSGVTDVEYFASAARFWVLTQAVLFMLWAFALVALLQAMGVGSDWSTDIDRAILFLSFGVSLALVRLWTGSLWSSIGYHLAFQVTMGLLSLDRLVIIRVDSSDLPSVGITLWASVTC